MHIVSDKCVCNKRSIRQFLRNISTAKTCFVYSSILPHKPNRSPSKMHLFTNRTSLSVLSVVLLSIVCIDQVHTIKVRMPTPYAIAELRNRYEQNEAYCMHDYNISQTELQSLRSPESLNHWPPVVPRNVQCFARCLIERSGYYHYETRTIDVEHFVLLATMVFELDETWSRYQVQRCFRELFKGEEHCEDFWNVYRCFRSAI